MFQNLKIQQKMIILIGTILVLFLITNFASLNTTKKINQTNLEFEQVGIPAIVAAEEIKADIASFRVFELRHIIAVSPQEMQEVEQEMKEIEQEIKEDIADYRESIRTRGSEDYINKIEQDWNAYVELHERIVELSKADLIQEAMNLVRSESFDMYTNLKQQVDNLVVFNQDMAAKLNQEGRREYTFVNVLTLVMIVIVLVISVVISIAIANSIIKPIRQLQDAMKKVVKGDLDIEIDYDASNELGNLARNVKSTIQTVSTIIKDLSYLTEEMSKGNFICESRAEDTYVGEFQPLLISANQMKMQLGKMVGSINESANQVNLGAEQVSSASQASSQGATQQASSVQELAATVNDISEQIRKNAENADNSSKQAFEVGEGIRESNAKMKQLMDAMNDIGTSSAEISKIIKTIEDIAFQTNILALNAAVEAARAGAAGKGFAVVADEVRNLASKSAEASKNTAQLIERSVQAVEHGTEIAQDTSRTLTETVEYAEKVIANIAEISEASNNQAQSVSQITIGLDQIAGVVQNNSATAEQGAAASEELASQAQALKDMVAKFQFNGQSQIVESQPSTPVSSFQETPKKSSYQAIPKSTHQVNHFSDKY